MTTSSHTRNISQTVLSSPSQIKSKDEKGLSDEERAERKRKRALGTKLSGREGPKAIKDY